MTDELARLLAAPPEDPTPDTASRITAAALELFAERSYEGATTSAIARRAGVTEKTLFKHFGSKERLFARTVYPALVRLIEPVALRDLRSIVTRPHASFAEGLEALVADRLAFVRAHPAIVKMLAQELMLRPAFREALAPVFRERVLPVVLPFFEQARARGEIADVPAEVALRTVVSVVAGYGLLTTLFAPGSAEQDAIEVKRLTGLLLDGLRG